MPAEIIFPDIEPEYIFDRDVLAIRALADGKPVQVMVTAELLMTRFSARDITEEALRDAYRQHKDEIQSIAGNHIKMGWIDEGRRVFLTTRYTRLHVTFDPRFAEWAPALDLAKTFHRILTDIIGPNAGEVKVSWNLSGELNQGRPFLEVRVSDASGPPEFWLTFDLSEAATNSLAINVRLAEMWSTLLKHRSQHLMSG
jgi:hypothetical protein